MYVGKYIFEDIISGYVIIFEYGYVGCKEAFNFCVEND